MKKRFLIYALLLCLAAGAVIKSEKEVDYSAEEEILMNMTLREKVTQMIMPSFRTWNEEGVAVLPERLKQVLSNNQFGGFILFAVNIEDSAQTAELIADVQSTAKIPMLAAVDQEGGRIIRLSDGTDMTGNMALGAAGNTLYAKKSGELIGHELKAIGFNADFAPVMDVNNNPANPIVGVRSFSDDPKLVSKLGSSMIEGLRENVAVSLKHFPGHGDTDTDSHTGLPCVDKSYEELLEFELLPFKAGIEAGADMVMTAHIQYPQLETETYISKFDGQEIVLPATLSRRIITDVLRTDLGFEGVVCTDALGMAAIADHFDNIDVAKMAINAGVDILLMPYDLIDEENVEGCLAYIDEIVALVEKGEISIKRIDESVLRILKLKSERGILDYSAKERAELLKDATEMTAGENNRAVEWEIALRSVTLVKNDGMLPLGNDVKKIVAFGGYDDELLPYKFALKKAKEAGLIGDVELKTYCYYQLDSLSDEFEKAVEWADVVLATSKTYSRTGLTTSYQVGFLNSLIEKTHKEGKKVAIISICLPYDVALFNEADALIACYNPIGMTELPNEGSSTYGASFPAAVYQLFKDEFNGTLPVNIYKLNEQAEYTDEILYERGFGLDLGAWYKRKVNWPVYAYRLKLDGE